MASDQLTPDGLIVPTPGPAKVIGILDIIFALVGLAMGLCCSVYTLMLPSMGPQIQAQQRQALAQQEAAIKEQVDLLRSVEEKATTEEAKAQVRAQIQMVEASAPPEGAPEVDFAKLGLNDPRYLGHFGADLASNVILNLLMFIAGIGLVGLKEWGRTLGVWVAALKIVRLLALTASLVFVVVPFVAQKAGAFGAQGGAQDAAPKGQPVVGPHLRPGPGVGEMVQAVTGMATGYAVGLLIFGSIYPAIALVVLTRPGVKAACLAADNGREDEVTR